MRDLARRSLAEFIGTFFLVLIGVGAIAVNAETGSLGHVGISLAFGFAVASMVYATGHVSGAHLNPAVTLAFAWVGRFPRGEIVPYAAAQMLGAASASFLLSRMLGLDVATGVTLPTVPNGSAVATEVLISFSLMFVIVSVATDDKASSDLAGLAIGLAVGMGALMAGPLTGASMNPARSFGPALASAQWSGHWIYWAAPIVGAALGAMAYEITRATLPAVQ